MVPTFTPFNNDKTQSVRYDLTQKYASYLVNKAYATGVFVNGSSGEFDSLTLDQRKKILQSWMKTQQVMNGKLTLINNVGSNTLQSSIQLAKHSAEQKVKAIAVISPSYFKPKNEQQVAKWIHAIAKQVPDIAVYYYHIPMLNSVQCQVNKALKLARDLSPNIVGVKFTDTRFDDMQKCRDQGFNVLVGADTLFAQALSKKADGIIGVSVNFIGQRFDKIYRFMKQKNDRKSADVEQKQCKEIFDKIIEYDLYPVCKWLMEHVSGLNFGPVRLPMQPLNQKEIEVLKEQLLVKFKK